MAHQTTTDDAASQGPETSPGSIVRAAVIIESALAVVALLFGALVQPPPWRQLDLSFGGFAMGLLAALPMFGGLLLATWFPIGPLRALDALVRQMIVPLFRSCTLAQMLLISLLAGVGEEMLFRSVIQAGIQQYTGFAWLALAIASVLFGLGHAISIAYFVLATAIGVYLGWLWLATGNLLVPILAHAAYDFAALVYLVRLRPAEPAVKR